MKSPRQMYSAFVAARKQAAILGRAADKLGRRTDREGVRELKAAQRAWVAANDKARKLYTAYTAARWAA